MEQSELESFCQAIIKGPAILFLGQGALRQYAGEDFFLTACASRFKSPSTATYEDLLERWSTEAPEHIVGILHNISIRIAVPEVLQSICEVSWNAVITSCFHEVLERSFAAEWRNVDPVFNDQRTPSDPRNRTQLHLFKLYGCVTRDVDTEEPPRNQIELLQRQAVASNMLAHLPELVTPQGILIIDALMVDDWLKIDVMAERIAQLGKGQAHLFSASEEMENFGHLPLLMRMGKLKSHRDSLLTVLQRGRAEGLIVPSEQNRAWVEGAELTLRSGKKHVFRPGDWRRLTGGLTVLSDANTQHPSAFASREDKYRAFREFLYGSHSTPHWIGYCHGFAFQRDQFSELVNAVSAALQSARIQEEPILVCGQSGVGKTVALADLAIQMRHDGWPVLYFGRNYTDLDYSVIETVCTQLEQIENTSTLLVWDSLAERHAYASLASYLASRGRKVVVVGSHYQHQGDCQCFAFSPTMEPPEAGRFLKHLRDIDPKLVEGIEPEEFARRNFLAWLWRLLPETRGRLRTGLLREFEAYEQSLDHSWAECPQQIAVEKGTLGDLLREAGITVTQSDFTESISVRSPTGGEAAKVERLSGLILVPARYGQDVPVDLVLRCLGREGFDVLRSALRSVPVYSWVEDDRGNHLVGARQPLEADIIVRTRFTRSEEIEFVRLLLSHVRLQNDWQVPNSEVDFAERLLRAVGPDSELRNPSADELVLLADTIATLIENNANRPNPRILFSEGHLRREALLRQKESLALDDPDRLTLQVRDVIAQYDKATRALSQAEITLSGSQSSQRNTRSLSFVHTEFASLYGFAQELHFLVAETHPNSEPQRLLLQALQQGFEEAVRHCKLASTYDAENAYPADVRFRVTRIRLKNDTALSSEQKASLVSDLCDILENDCWGREREQYERRRIELAEILGDESLQEQALQSLEQMGSTAGEYLLAWNSIYDRGRTWRPPGQIASGLKRIERLGDRARRDLRLVRLYTRAWWQLFGNPNLFAPDSERITVKLTPEQWEHYALWLRHRLSFEEEASLHAKFSYAWALFQTGHYREAEDTFRILDRDTVAGRYRVIRLATWCDAAGTPILCQGTVRRVMHESDKGWVYVPPIRREVAFRPRDCHDQVIRAGEPLNDFHIAFNFRGPIADPARFYKR